MDEHLSKEYVALKEKIGFHLSRVIAYPLTPPEHVYLSLTNRCNLKCKMCDIYKNPSSKEHELSTDIIKDVIAQIKEMGIKHLIFSGGEPLLRDDLVELVEFAVLRGLGMVDIISNGTLFNDDIIRRLINSGLNHITISLDGVGKVNDEIRGEGVFDKAAANIDRINYWKRRYESAFPTIGINFTIMDNNIDEILPMVEFARDKNCNILVFQPLLSNNTKMFEKEESVLWPKKESVSKMIEVFKEVKKLKNELSNLFIYTADAIIDSIPRYFEGKRLPKDFKCYEAIKRIVITYEGKVWSCVGIYGDLKQNSLRDIWHSKEAYKVRKKVRKCRQHCLQDCVYFPSNVFEEIDLFLKKLEENGDVELKKNFIQKIEYYINQHLSSLRRCSPNWITAFKIRAKVNSVLKKYKKGAF